MKLFPVQANPTCSLAFFVAVLVSSVLPLNAQTGRPSGGQGRPGGDGPKPQIGRVVGRVLDAGTGDALPFASVVLLSARDSSVVEGVLSGDDGNFDMREVEVGRHVLEIRFPGYLTSRSEPHMFSPRNPESLTWNVGDVSLEADITNLDEAVVIEQASVMEMKVDRRVFHVGSDLTNRGGNTTELLENIPSVAVDIDGNITLRGSAGVQILIDGRPSGLSGGAREAFLESLPASAVDRVELITNPSARFDPDGTAGILNIVLKKNKLEGVSGQLQATYGTGDNHDANASLNYRNSAVSLSTNVGWNDRWMYMAGETDRTQYWSSDSTSLSHVERPGDSHRGSVSGSFKLEWRTSESWTLFSGVNMNQGVRDGWDSTTTQEVWTGGVLNGLSTSALRVEESSNDSRGGDAFAGFEKSFGSRDHKWTADLRRSYNDRLGRTDFRDVSLSAELPFGDVLTFNDEDTKTSRWLAQTDYERPWGEKGKFEAGLKTTWNVDRSDFSYTEADSSILTEGVFVPYGLDTVDYAFLYDEQIHAAYVTAGQTFGIVGMQVGLRAEQAYTSAQLEGAGQLNSEPFKNDYFSVYPTANLFVETDGENTWSVSYSRRVNRPGGRQLNPYLDMSDPRNFRSGNPFLLPEYTNSYEAAHQWQRGRTSVTTSAFFKDTRDVIRRYTAADTSTGILTSSFQNLGRQHSEGLEMALMLPLGKTGRLNWTASAYRIVNDGSRLESAFSTSGFSWSSRFFASWALGPDWKLQANSFVRGAAVTPQGRFNGFATLNLAASRDLPGDHWQITVQAKDIFNTRRWSYSTLTSEFEQDVWRQRESRNLYVTLQYKFGKLDERGRRGSGRGDDGGGGDDFMMD
jgi:outer membrane receptor protein involved in Fe transport